MAIIDENLRNGGAAIGALEHLGALRATHRNVIFLGRDALRGEQFHRARAIRAEGFGVDFDLWHCQEMWGAPVVVNVGVNVGRINPPNRAPAPSTGSSPLPRPRAARRRCNRRLSRRW